jgi:mono/diheme cytochrome c family protein
MKGRCTLQSLALGLFVLTAGCNKSEPATPEAGPPPYPGASSGVPETEPHAAGKKVFNANCYRCHNIESGQKKQGPDLAKVSSNSEHTPEWISEHIRNPRGHKPDSRMPPFKGKINDDDFKALIDFLSSLK